jgi:hypothetical protein
MGLVLRPDCIVLIRPLNRTRIAWSDIDSFALIMPRGWIDYGNRRVGVKRHRSGLIPHTTLSIPTVWVAARQRSRWVAPFGACGLRSAGGEITDVMGFLSEQLRAHRNVATSTTTSANTFASTA